MSEELCPCGCGQAVVQNPAAPNRRIYATPKCARRMNRRRLVAADVERLGRREVNKRRREAQSESLERDVAEVRLQLYGDQTGRPSLEAQAARIKRGLRAADH
jgi:hypothetical protein